MNSLKWSWPFPMSRPYSQGPNGPEGLGDGEEDGDGLRSDLDREDLADGQVGGAGPGGGEEEDHAPADGLGRRVERSGVEQERADSQQSRRRGSRSPAIIRRRPMVSNRWPERERADAGCRARRT